MPSKQRRWSAKWIWSPDGRYANAHHAADDDFSQPGSLYRDVMSDVDREHLVQNIVGHASDEVQAETQLRVIAYWSAVDPDLGRRVAAGLGVDLAAQNGQYEAARAAVLERAGHA